jgi:uncharacterized membrane protein YphA (DoxX/SURF4 family)
MPIMFEHRRYLSTFAVFALVLLRLVIGWHFFREGTQKVVYDPRDGELRMTFSAEEFFTRAKGPLSGWYQGSAPDNHGWRQLLATPRRNVPPSEAQAAEQAEWQAEYERRRAEAKAEGEPAPIEFPPFAPYREWAERIGGDWRSMGIQMEGIPALSEDGQDQKIDQTIDNYLQRLADYLATQTSAIAEYRHELWRLDNWRKSPESGDVPFVDERIAAKSLETTGTPMPWLNQVKQLRVGLRSDLQAILTDEQRGQALTTAAVEDALSDPRQDRLHLINVVVTCLTIGVGVCLLLGLFTRLASIVGALFLLGVILSQPPWLPDTIPTMPNVIEFAGLLVLAGTGAGRWFGLDFFTYALFNRRREIAA